MTLTELIKDNYVTFLSYRQGFFYYILRVNSGGEKVQDGQNEYIPKRIPTYDNYQFTIPADDIGTGTLRASMKAIECMRWIRKSMESGELLKLS